MHKDVDIDYPSIILIKLNHLILIIDPVDPCRESTDKLTNPSDICEVKQPQNFQLELPMTQFIPPLP